MVIAFVSGTGRPSFSCRSTGSGREAATAAPPDQIWACSTASVSPPSDRALYT